ncbi:MAG: hypothetical protein ABSG90_10345 [Dehalococcoidia bacterium]|jgi:hypothetical protein
MINTQLSQKFEVGQRVRIFSVKDDRSKPKYPAWEQHVDLQGIVTGAYHSRYGPLIVDGSIGCDYVRFYNVAFDGNFTISIPEEMLEAVRI